MALSIPRSMIVFILLGPMEGRRQLQDSPILGDVWVEFGRRPDARLDLLISPFMTRHAGEVAAAINDGLGDEPDEDPSIACLQGLVAARLTFDEVLSVVVPKTKWWIDKWTLPRGSDSNVDQRKFEHEAEQRYGGANPKVDLAEELTKLIHAAQDWNAKKQEQRRALDLVPFDRFAGLVGLLLWAAKHQESVGDDDPLKVRLDKILSLAKDDVRVIAGMLIAVSRTMRNDDSWRKKEPGPEQKAEPLIYQVSLNRNAMPALTLSVPAVKADAATNLFRVNCREIAWAVLDSGIDGDHPAFGTPLGDRSRVRRSFDFKNFRKIVSFSNTKFKTRKGNLEALMEDGDSLLHPLNKEDSDRALEKLAEDASNRGPVRWDLVEPFIEIRPETEPATNHGTHVAGIIGANKKAAMRSAGLKDEDLPPEGYADGMCPDISLYDFRVLAPDPKDAEFAIIAALQFIRYLNDRDNFFTIHGANLSLSIPHDVHNFACGRTPICVECERLVETGVVVVAAAGNHGYKSFDTADGAFESYAAFSITDPGNANEVITVGSTHRYWPHTYGVSFFSSRGPTGDGRLKPDLVAPGERIHAPFPKGEWGDLDGTSMAAPHVSGAAAMLLARYAELIGQPRRVKSILCKSATDLGRERSFQGHGMLDVLRALQSI